MNTDQFTEEHVNADLDAVVASKGDLAIAPQTDFRSGEGFWAHAKSDHYSDWVATRKRSSPINS
jgi:hypothetical protein